MTITEPNAGVSATNLGSVEPRLGRHEPAAHTDLGIPSTVDPSAPDSPAGLFDSDSYAGEADSEHRGNGAMTAEGVTEAAPGGTPIPSPIPFPIRRASGRYRSPATGFQLELRVDVDGTRPLGKLSGDYHSVAGGSTTYFGSWTVDAVTVTRTPAATIVVGTARTTWPTTYTVATVTIPRRIILQPPAPATIRWSTPSGATGATYVCAHESASFRTVELEQDREAGVTPFVDYNTGSLPSGGPARTLSVAASYAEAGIQMLDTGAGNTIATSPTHIWTNASLHNAMQANFSRFADRPQFKVWLLHARAHEIGTGLLGIMFDQQGPQRQGCASFYQSISSGSAAHRRDQLYVNVHELGHCFNLFHSFHKTFMTPPLPNRPGALSWMNYPRFFDPGGGAPSGEAAYWAAFPFQFDTPELTHVRHAFRNAVIMGGNPFGTGAALDVGEAYADPIMDRSGLGLTIGTAPERPVLGTPVVLTVNLAVDRRQLVHQPDQLHPKYGFVQVAISRPRGDVVVHRPPIHHCAEPDLMVGERGASLPTSAYIGYDAVVGQVFEDVGTYRIRASYAAADGTVVLSNVTTVRIAAPRDDRDEQVSELMLGDQTGMVLTLLGTDSQYLAAGTDALRTVEQEFGEHQNAVYARLALGINAARPFTDVRPDGSVRERGRDLDEADRLVGAAVDASRGDTGLDDVTTVQAMAYLAGGHAAEGDAGRADALREEATQLAQDKGMPAAVIDNLDAGEQ